MPEDEPRAGVKVATASPALFCSDAWTVTRETALASLLAGADRLPIPGGDEVATVAKSLAAAAVRNPIVGERLRNAANRVRALVNATDLCDFPGKQKRG